MVGGVCALGVFGSFAPLPPPIEAASAVPPPRLAGRLTREP